MKIGVILILLLMISGLTTAEAVCDLNVTMLQQDPYPAVPGDYVKLVFQADGTDSPACKNLNFNLLEQYPIKFNPGETGLRNFKRVDYIKDYAPRILIPYEVRLDENALDGPNKIKVELQSGTDAPIIKEFNIEVNDPRADFEVHIKNYNYATKDLTLEVLNIAESNTEALVVNIPKQENIIIKGPNKVIVGDLDSNEYTTADFEATPSNGEIKLELIYSDSTNTRRTKEETIKYDSTYFTNRIADQKTTPIWTYALYVAIFLVLIYWIFKRKNKNKK